MLNTNKSEVPTAGKLKRLCYVIYNFPRISETFIVEEALSLNDFGVDFSILALKKGNFDLVHPSAQSLIDQNKITYVGNVSKSQALIALMKLMLIFPSNTLKTLIKAINHPLRWCYFQALPYAPQILKTKTDYIHAHFADYNLWFAAILSEWSGVPYGFTAHRYDILDDPLTVEEFTDLANRAHVVVTVSKANERIMKQKYRLGSKEIYVAYNGIRVEQFRPEEKAQNDTVIQLLNVGRLAPEKGQDILINAIAKVVEKGFNIKLYIIGEGLSRNDLEAQIEHLDLHQYVELLGAKSQQDVRRYMKDADVFVMPSRSEGFGVACIEAMAMELPVIVTDGLAFPEIITNYENGILTDIENTDTLANAIIWMIENPRKRIEMGKKARERVLNNFTREKVTSGLLEHINKALERGKSVEK